MDFQKQGLEMFIAMFDIVQPTPLPELQAFFFTAFGKKWQRKI